MSYIGQLMIEHVDNCDDCQRIIDNDKLTDDEKDRKLEACFQDYQESKADFLYEMHKDLKFEAENGI